VGAAQSLAALQDTRSTHTPEPQRWLTAHCVSNAHSVQPSVALQCWPPPQSLSAPHFPAFFAGSLAVQPAISARAQSPDTSNPASFPIRFVFPRPKQVAAWTYRTEFAARDNWNAKVARRWASRELKQRLRTKRNLLLGKARNL
jgi:hypothetical protein